MDVIKRMIPMTPYLFTPVYGALKRKHVDVLGVLLDADYARGEQSTVPLDRQTWLREAKATGDEEVIAVVERYIRKSEKRARKSAAKARRRKTTGMRKWWQHRLPANVRKGSQPQSSDISPPTDSSTKTWWLLRKIQNIIKPSGSYHKEKDLDDSVSEKDL